MASTFVGSINVQVNARRTITGGLSTPQEDLAWQIALALADGTGVEQAQRFYNTTLALTGAAQTLDLHTSLTDGLGAAFSLATVRALIIKNKATTAGYTLSVGAAASNPFGAMFGNAASDILVIRPGGLAVLTAPRDGYTVTNSSADQLKFDPGANTFDADVIIIGTV